MRKTKKRKQKSVKKSRTFVEKGHWKKKKESFTVFMCTEGSFVLVTPHFKSEFKKGDTVLIPAILDEFQIIGETSLLEITI